MDLDEMYNDCGVEVKRASIWQCKIGPTDRAFLPNGSDWPMRRAVADAFFELTEHYPEFIFSGWNAELDETERAVVEDREPA